MSDQFVAEIRAFPFNFAPVGWARCDGQLLPIAQNTALFSLLGTMYGGDGKSTFALPDLQGSMPMHHGLGPGLSDYFVGQVGGAATATLLEAQMPAHRHPAQASNSDAIDQSPQNSKYAPPVGVIAYGDPTNLVDLAPATVPGAGGGQPHNNLQPYVTLTFCIALQGIFPQRS